jgi:hypothetical protein
MNAFIPACMKSSCGHTFHTTQAMNVHHARHLDASTLPPPLETKFPLTLPVTDEMVPHSSPQLVTKFPFTVPVTDKLAQSGIRSWAKRLLLHSSPQLQPQSEHYHT